MDYRVVKSLGVGAGSTILQISDRTTGHSYALKVVKRLQPSDSVYLDQALVEYEVSQRLNHPNILRVYDVRVKHRWFRKVGVELLMELVDGRTLDEFESLDLGRLLLVFIQVAAGLEHMHRRGVYHGDLKPGNIMVSRTGDVKIIDFGTAWLRGQEKNRVQGTLQYMAPEQASRKIVDDRTDLYNFGATMYRMFTGQYANAGGVPQDAEGLMKHLIKAKPAIQLNEDIPAALDKVIMACLDPTPERRPVDIHKVRERMASIAEKMGLKTEDLKARA